MDASPHAVIVVGAGPAGLATAAELQRRGVRPLVLEAGAAPGQTWRSLYDRLHLHTVKQLSGLPGLPMPRAYPRYPSRQQVADYLAAYARHFALEIRTGCRVQRAVQHDGLWHVTTEQGTLRACALVAATGIFAQPVSPHFPGMETYRGTLLHASAYANAAPYAGQRVLVVGVGNTGAEIAVDLADGGAQPTLAIREGANVVPRELLGIPMQRWAHVSMAVPRSVMRRVAPLLLRRAILRQRRAGVPRPALSALERPGVPVIGLDLLRYTQSGRIHVAGAVERLTEHGAVLRGSGEQRFDAIVLATGYRPALGYLADAVPLDAAGWPRLAGVRALDAPHLAFVGAHYDLRGTLYNIAREAPEAAVYLAPGNTQRDAKHRSVS